MQKENISTDTIVFIIKKFQKQGFEKLSLPDLAVAVSIPEFREYFIRQTGQDWATKYELKALQKLQSAHFDMQWMIQKEEQSQKPFFLACSSGDIQKVKDILRKSSDDSYKLAVDRTKKTGLHVAAEQGHSVLVEFLLMQGFNPNSRDKQLKTPLHYACTKGNEYIVNILLQQGAVIDACDGYNRSCLHYACCSPSNHVVILMVGMKPELVHNVDNNLLTPLHYAVLNNSQKQIEIIRTLIEQGTNVNARDQEGKTALWYASHQGKSRIIPILLKKNADINISDYEQLQTPLDVAANQRTRELLIVYSQAQSDPQPKKEDVQWMDAAIKGEPIQPQQSLFAMPTLSEQQQQQQQQTGTQSMALQNTQINNQLSQTQQQQRQLNSTINQQGETMSSLSRERFFQMMKKIQEEGIKAFQHIKKPFIYTGSWMEGVQSLGDLYHVMSEIQATEAVLCVFNLLCPYDKPLPKDDGQEVIDGFYGDPWKQALKSPLEEKLEREKKIQAQIGNMEVLKKKVREKEKALTDQIYELNECRKDNDSLRQQLEKLQSQKNEINKENLNEEIQGKDAELVKTKKKLVEIKQELKEKTLIIEQLEAQQENNEEKQDNIENIEKIVHLEEELRIEKQKNKVQRFKSGQLFLKTLGQGGIKKQKGLTASNQDNLQDDEAIIRMFSALKDNPPNFVKRLQIVDKNGDNKINRDEFIEFCNKLKLSQQDIMSLQRIVGFADGKKLLGIQEFQKILQARPQERQASEEKLFKKILDSFSSKGKTLEEVFQEIDTDGSGELSLGEFRKGLEDLKIILNQKDLNNIFCIFDKDKSGSITLAEMKETIDLFKDKLEGKILDDQEEQQQEQQQQIQRVNFQKLSQEENQQLLDEGKQANNDDQELNGQLKVQLPRIRKFWKNVPYLYIQIEMAGLDQEVILDKKQVGDKGDLFYAFKLNIKFQSANSLNDFLVIKLFKDSNINEENYLGEIKVAWKCCIQNPDQFYISKEFTVGDLTYQNSDIKGYLGVQARYQPIAGIKIQKQDNDDYAQDLIPPKEFSPVRKQNEEMQYYQNNNNQYQQDYGDLPTSNYKEVIKSRNQESLIKQKQQYLSVNQNNNNINQQQQYQNSDKDLEAILENQQDMNQKDYQYLQEMNSDISGYIDDNNNHNNNNNKMNSNTNNRAQIKENLINNSNIYELLDSSDFVGLQNPDYNDIDSNASSILNTDM